MSEQGLWLLPTKGRIANLKRFLNAAREMGTASPGLVLVNAEEWLAERAAYEALRSIMPQGWDFRAVAATCYGDALRAIWPAVKDLRWVGLVADDLVPASSGWDTSLVSALVGWNFVSSNDGWQARADGSGRMHGATAWSGDLLRAVGWLFPAGLRHVFHDDIWETIGRETGCWSTKMDVMTRHLHEALDGIIGPTMDPQSALWQADEARFAKWGADEKAGCIARVRALMQRYNVTTMRADFANVSLMIGTPAIDGRYDSHYLVSLWNTMTLMKDHGVVCQLAEEKFTADISLARAKVLAAFLRSTATHLLMVDADMGWHTDAVIRLFCAQKDLVAVAGPKKRYPLSFAANYTDASGTPIALVHDRASGTMEVGEVGMAFALLTRDAAERLVKSYPELSFRGVTGEREWALFNPIVANDRYYSEDFAFCWRARAIGIGVHIVPDVRLKHVGTHCFEGSFSEACRPVPLEEAAAE